MFLRAGSWYFNVGSISRAIWGEDEGELVLYVGPQDQHVQLTGAEAAAARELLEACCVVPVVNDPGPTEPAELPGL